MQWERAKTILIVMFLFMNIGLFAMNLRNAQRYKITEQDVAVITKILGDSNVSIGCGVPLNNRPVSIFNALPYEWDLDDINSVFFPADNDVTRTNEGGWIIFESAGSGVSVTLRRTGGETELRYHEESARSGDKEYYKNLLGKRFRNFRLVRGDGKTFLYNEVVKNAAFFDSSLEIAFLEDGGVSMLVRKRDYAGSIDGVLDVSRADEALLSFMHYKNDFISGHVIIEGIELGYGVDNASSERAAKAKPYYRIFVFGRKEPVLIDALMNTVINVYPAS